MFRERLSHLLIAVVLLVGCTSKAPPPIPPTPSPFPELGISTSNYPRVDGSTSAIPIQMMIACKILDASTQWHHSESDDTRYLTASDINESFLNENYRGEKLELCKYINRTIAHQGTHESYVNLIRDKAELILVARLPSDDEVNLARKAKVEFDARPAALDAFVFLLNGRNPVKSLTIDQIRDIYSGRIKNWRDVGGVDAPIQPYQRTRNSGSQELMKKLVMKDREMTRAPDVLIETLMSATILRIDEDRNGIAYSLFFYKEFVADFAGVLSCAVNGVSPTAETIRNRSYPLVTEVFVVIRKDLSSDNPAKKLRDWILSPAGQRVVEETGYVPIGDVE